MTPKVLIFGEDESANQSLVRLYQRAGYEAAVADPQQAPTFALRQLQPDLVVICDLVNLAASTALARSVRQVSDVPLLAAPQHHNDHAEVTLISAGCDDYISLDRSARALIARTERQLFRRQLATARDLPQRVGPLTVSAAARTATWDGRPVQLTRTEFDILRILVANAHRVVHRKELINLIWGAWYSDDHVLEVHVSRLRHKFKVAGAKAIISPVRGVGYRLNAEPH